ncbi:MAG: hypothetical protein JWQ35_470 [Bacteriovoracaceae bacterium]|nr:hypothetical protein [Bacteriovoracaceae bacterium]
MGDRRLKIWSEFFSTTVLCLLLSACISEKGGPVVEVPKTFFTSSLPPKTLLIVSEQFLEYQKGYSLKVRDHSQGIAVTDWAMDAPDQRHRITLRAEVAIKGSILSTHTETQVMENDNWVELPSSGLSESKLLAELKDYIEHTASSRSKTLDH